MEKVSWDLAPAPVPASEQGPRRRSRPLKVSADRQKLTLPSSRTRAIFMTTGPDFNCSPGKYVGEPRSHQLHRHFGLHSPFFFSSRRGSPYFTACWHIFSLLINEAVGWNGADTHAKEVHKRSRTTSKWNFFSLHLHAAPQLVTGPRINSRILWGPGDVMKTCMKTRNQGKISQGCKTIFSFKWEHLEIIFWPWQTEL